MLIDTTGQPCRTRRSGGLGLRPVRQYDTAGEVRMAYDLRGRVVEQVRRVFEDIDALDRVVEQTAPNGSVTAYSYAPGGKLVGIELDAAAVVEEILYNARGQRLSIAYGNGTETTYEYDEDRFWLNRLLTMRSTEALQDLSYTHDAVGNVLGIEDEAQEDLYFDNTQVTADQTFTYDSLYRLVQATGREKVGMAQTTFAPPAPGAIPDGGDPALRTYTQSTTYDAAGNITQVHHVPSSGSNWTRNYTIHDDNNQLLATSIPGNSSAYDDEYSYNERGAMVFMPHLRSGVSENVVRDFRDQVRKVLLLNSGDEAWYATDAAGQRVRKVVRQGQYAHERIYVGGNEIYRKLNTVSEELDEEIQTVHVMDGEQRVLMAETRTVVDDEPVTSPVAVLRYQYSNHLGTATLECDEDGEIIGYEEYHPYGTTAWWAQDSSIQVSLKRYRYTGMERDEETGMQMHGVRGYMPWLGRWERVDPAGLIDGGNRWAYVRGNPVGLADPTGLAAPTIARLLGVDDASLDASLRADSSLSNQLKQAVKKNLYDAADVLTGGVLAKHDAAFEARVSGSITGGQYLKNTGGAVAIAGVEIGVAAVTGGTGKTVSSSVRGVARATITGAGEGAVTAGAAAGAQQLLDASTGMSQGVDAGAVIQAAGTGVLFGAGGGYAAGRGQRGLEFQSSDSASPDVAVLYGGAPIPEVRVGVRGAAKGAANPIVARAATTGQEAHRQIEASLAAKGYLTEVTMTLPSGQTVRKDAVMPGTNKVVIIKPDTPSGVKTAERRADLMSSQGYDPDIIYYDPKDPAFQTGSPTYIGPK